MSSFSDSLDQVLIVIQSGQTPVFRDAIQDAHRISGSEPFLVDFPGLGQPHYQNQRESPLGRILLMYGRDDFLDEIKMRLQPRYRNTPMVLGLSEDLVQECTVRISLDSPPQSPDRWKGVSLQRRALRRISQSSAAKKAQRLEKHLMKKGVSIDRPIEVHNQGLINKNGRMSARVARESCGKLRYSDHLLVLKSSQGHRFANHVIREPLDIEKPVLFPSGQRDSYGFGGKLPAVQERLIFQSLFGRQDEDQAA